MLRVTSLASSPSKSMQDYPRSLQRSTTDELTSNELMLHHVGGQPRANLWPTERTVPCFKGLHLGVLIERHVLSLSYLCDATRLHDRIDERCSCLARPSSFQLISRTRGPRQIASSRQSSRPIRLLLFRSFNPSTSSPTPTKGHAHHLGCRWIFSL